MYVRARYTQSGQGPSAEGGLLSNLIETDVGPDDYGKIVLQKIMYTQHFLDQRLFLSLGKADPETFLDQNNYANDQRSQFSSQAFVDNPVFDDEDAYDPFLAAGGNPFKRLKVAAIIQSMSRPSLAGDEQTDPWDNLFNDPFVGAEATWSPEFRGLKGNYRLNGWGALYPHPLLDKAGHDDGWGIGISLDQEVHDKIGLFARAGHQNRRVYRTAWFWSCGTSMTGILPGRERDVLGLGVAGLKSDQENARNGTELHMEAYYRIRLNRYLFLSPDLQYIHAPLGNDSNQDVIAGMVRLECHL